MFDPEWLQCVDHGIDHGQARIVGRQAEPLAAGGDHLRVDLHCRRAHLELAVAKAREVAFKTDRIIAQNFKWALGYNFIVLIPAALGYVPPWLAAIGMSLSSLFVVLNALRLKRA